MEVNGSARDVNALAEQAVAAMTKAIVELPGGTTP
jgi:hypothetical protein